MNCLKTSSSLSWYLDVGYHYGTMTVTQARRLAGVHRTTWDRYIKGEISAPPALLELLRMTAFGEPPGGFSKEWDGFRFQNGILSTPYGDLTPSDLKQFWLFKQVAYRAWGEESAAEYQKQQNQQAKELKLCVI